MRVRLGEVAKESRETLRGSKRGLPVVGLEHLEPGELSLTVWDADSENTFSKTFRKGQMLFGRRRAYLKKAAIAPFDGICSGDITVIEASTDRLMPELLPFIIQNDAFFTYAVGKSAGSLSPRAKWEHLQNFEFDLPPLAEQQKLAELLWAANATREAYKKLLTKTDELVKSQFVEMFGDPVTNSKGLSVAPLGELCSIYRGGSPRPINEYLGGTIPWIKIGDATSGDDIYLHSTKDFIIEEGMAKSRFVKSGSLIFANCGVSLGFARIITFDGCIHDGWLSLESIDELINKEFLLKSLNHCTEYFRATAPDGTQPNLNTGIMKAFLQVIPPLDIQNRFADFVRAAGKSKFVALEATKALNIQRMLKSI